MPVQHEMDCPELDLYEDAYFSGADTLNEDCILDHSSDSGSCDEDLEEAPPNKDSSQNSDEYPLYRIVY